MLVGAENEKLGVRVEMGYEELGTAEEVKIGVEVGTDVSNVELGIRE